MNKVAALARIASAGVVCSDVQPPAMQRTPRQQQAWTLLRSTLNLVRAFGTLPPEPATLAHLDDVTVDDFSALAVFFESSARSGHAVRIDPSTSARLARVFKLLSGNVDG